MRTPWEEVEERQRVACSCEYLGCSLYDIEIRVVLGSEFVPVGNLHNNGGSEPMSIGEWVLGRLHVKDIRTAARGPRMLLSPARSSSGAAEFSTAGLLGTPDSLAL